MKADKVIIALLFAAAAILAAGLFYFGRPVPVAEARGNAAETAPRTTDGGSAALPGDDSPGGSRLSADKTNHAPRSMGATDALLELAQITDPRAREDYINAMFRPLAAQGVPQAMAAVRQLPDAASRDMAMLTLLGEWSGLSVTQLVQQGDVGRFGVAGALGLHLMREGKISPQETAAWADEFLSGDQRVGVLGRAAEKLATTDPQSALALGDDLTDWQQTRFLSRFVSGWASVSPEAAHEWVGKVEDPRMRSVLMARVVNEQVKVDPAAAAQTFTEEPPEDARVRERTARQIAEGWASRDTVAAMQWADGLTEEADRTAARQGISRAAPVGIGARVTTGNDGVPVLQDFVAGAPASTSGQLRSGDRVLAVSDAGGAWVSSRSMSADEVARLIRGQANTQVSLQVQSSANSGVRVVTLPRAQIIHRPSN